MSENLKFSVLLSVYSKEKRKNLELSLKSIYDDQILKPDEIVLVEDGPLTEELYAEISFRVKEIQSIIKKIQKKSKIKKTYSYNDLTDKLGIRIICPFLSDLDIVDKILKVLISSSIPLLARLHSGFAHFLESLRRRSSHHL